MKRRALKQRTWVRGGNANKKKWWCEGPESTKESTQLEGEKKGGGANESKKKNGDMKKM